MGKEHKRTKGHTNLFLVSIKCSLVYLIFTEIYFFLLDGISTFESSSLVELCTQMLWCMFFIAQFFIIKLIETFSKTDIENPLTSINYVSIVFILLLPLSSLFLFTSSIAWSKLVFFINLLSLCNSIKIKTLLLIYFATMVGGTLALFCKVIPLNIIVYFELCLLIHLLISFMLHLATHSLAKQIVNIKKKPLCAFDNIDPYFYELERRAIIIRNNLIYYNQNNINVDIIGNILLENEINNDIFNYYTFNSDRIGENGYIDKLNDIKYESFTDIDKYSINTFYNSVEDTSQYKHDLQENVKLYTTDDKCIDNMSSFNPQPIDKNNKWQYINKSEDKNDKSKQFRRNASTFRWNKMLFGDSSYENNNIRGNNRGNSKGNNKGNSKGNNRGNNKENKEYNKRKNSIYNKYIQQNSCNNTSKKKEDTSYNYNQLNSVNTKNKLNEQNKKSCEEILKKKQIKKNESLLRINVGKFNRTDNIILSEERRYNINYVYFDNSGNIRKSKIIPVYIFDRHNLSNISTYVNCHIPIKIDKYYKYYMLVEKNDTKRFGYNNNESDNSNRILTQSLSKNKEINNEHMYDGRMHDGRIHDGHKSDENTYNEAHTQKCFESIYTNHKSKKKKTFTYRNSQGNFHLNTNIINMSNDQIYNNLDVMSKIKAGGSILLDNDNYDNKSKNINSSLLKQNVNEKNNHKEHMKNNKNITRLFYLLAPMDLDKDKRSVKRESSHLCVSYNGNDSNNDNRDNNNNDNSDNSNNDNSDSSNNDNSNNDNNDNNAQTDKYLYYLNSIGNENANAIKNRFDFNIKKSKKNKKINNMNSKELSDYSLSFNCGFYVDDVIDESVATNHRRESRSVTSEHDVVLTSLNDDDDDNNNKMKRDSIDDFSENTDNMVKKESSINSLNAYGKSTNIFMSNSNGCISSNRNDSRNGRSGKNRVSIRSGKNIDSHIDDNNGGNRDNNDGNRDHNNNNNDDDNDDDNTYQCCNRWGITTNKKKKKKTYSKKKLYSCYKSKRSDSNTKYINEMKNKKFIKFYDYVSLNYKNEPKNVSTANYYWKIKNFFLSINPINNIFNVLKICYKTICDRSAKFSKYSGVLQNAQCIDMASDIELKHAFKYNLFLKWYNYWVKSISFNYFKKTYIIIFLLLFLNIILIFLHMQIIRKFIKLDIQQYANSVNGFNMFNFFDNHMLEIGQVLTNNNLLGINNVLTHIRLPNTHETLINSILINTQFNESQYNKFTQIRFLSNLFVIILLVIPSIVVKNYKRVKLLNIFSIINCLVIIFYGMIDIIYSTNCKFYKLTKLFTILKIFNVFDLFLIGKVLVSIFIIPFITNFNEQITIKLIYLSCICYVGAYYYLLTSIAFTFKMMCIINTFVIIALAIVTAKYSRLVMKSRKMLYVKYVLPYFVYLTLLNTDPSIQLTIKEKKFVNKQTRD